MEPRPPRRSPAPLARESQAVPAALSRYDTLQDFYAARGGERSGETDFGLFHYPEEDAAVPAWQRNHWRVSVVADTGDVYAQNLQRGTVRLLGTLAATDPPTG